MGKDGKYKQIKEKGTDSQANWTFVLYSTMESADPRFHCVGGCWD